MNCLLAPANLAPQRPNIPASNTSSTSASTFDLFDWGAASAVYLSETCNTTQFFQPQQMIFDITLCGDWFVPHPPASPSFL
jgi:hypothetical protein